MDFKIEEEKVVVKTLIEKGKKKHCERGESLYSEGQKPMGLYYVEKGLVGLTKISASGSESLLRIFKQEQFFGHRTLFSNETYHGNAKCLEPTEIIFCPAEVVFGTFDQNPRAYFFLARALAKELRRAELRSVLISEGDVQERVAAALLLFKKLYPDHLWTRTEIANYCASRTPTVIKALGKLEEMGAIKQQRRHIDIVDDQLLLSVFE